MKIAIDVNDVIRDNMLQFNVIYKKYVDPNFDTPLSEITSYNMLENYSFNSEESLEKFRYFDYPWELYGDAPTCDRMVQHYVNYWVNKTLGNLDEEYIPDVMLFSPFEMAATIQATYSFLGRVGSRIREIYFPKDSSTIYDRADIVITAQPSLIENCPKDKIVIKINKPYNKDIKVDYSFDSIMQVINDDKETIINLIKEKVDGEEK